MGPELCRIEHHSGCEKSTGLISTSAFISVVNLAYDFLSVIEGS